MCSFTFTEVFDEEVTAFEAEKRCLQRNSRLVFFKTREEYQGQDYQFLKNQLFDNDNGALSI